MLSTLSRRAIQQRASLVACRAAAQVPAVSYNEVKFVKEDVEKVMMELPDYNFYEFKESVPNPYQGSTLDRSILLDPPTAALVPPKFEFSKLENGIKIASVDKQGLTARLGLFVHAGARFESSANLGVAHMTSLMGFRSTAHLSHLRTVKTLEQMGADQSAKVTAGREEILYQVDVQREMLPYVVPLMVGNVLFPRFLPWEVRSAQGDVKTDKEGILKNPDSMVNELLHKAAFCNNTLGRSPLMSERSMSYFTPETVRGYLLDHFAPERMVFVGVNVAHSELTKWVMRSFADYNAIPLKKREEVKASYTGGDMRLEGSSPYCHLALGLESVAFGQAELAPVALIQEILGGGTAAYTGIGAGVTSRLSTTVVKQNPFVESCMAFNTSYSDAGLFGVYGVGQADKAGDMAKAMASALKSTSSVSKEELAKAKAMLKGKMLRQADKDGELMMDMGQQLLMTGKYGSAAEFAKIIDGVTEAEVAACATKMLGSKLSIAAFGDIHAVPSYASLEAALK